MKLVVETNPLTCPFCHQANYCSNNENRACWCFNTKVPQELIELLPNSVINKSCICSKCVDNFRESPSLFKSTYSPQ
ncbi:cysteine-rich CWC family protein [Paraglaciecola sp.]|uniref:cysteine-rich CWC family protein n=1 Tax=Paraglaciecola sp. TaxID=1920173 RepID=UPI003EF6ABBE